MQNTNLRPREKILAELPLRLNKNTFEGGPPWQVVGRSLSHHRPRRLSGSTCQMNTSERVQLITDGHSLGTFWPRRCFDQRQK